jgi:hypothetical protein
MASTLRPDRTLAVSTWSIVAAFGTYFCMYGYRKPFTAGIYDDVSVLGIGLKTVLVSSQVFGYMASKFVGIRVIAEMKPERRAVAILALIGLAHLALLGFGLVPPPWNFVFLFLNGLPLGMVFGLVLGFLEGRRQTEALVAGLCASFILADGVAKSVGTSLLGWGVGRYWMPFMAGLVFAGPLLIFVWMLTKIPKPSMLDVDQRSERSPMTRLERGEFFAKYAVGLTLLILIYLLVTILRSLRADFAPEIWKGLGYSGQAAIFTQSETWVMFGVIVVNGSTILFRANRRAFFAGMTVVIGGLLLVGLAVFGLDRGLGGFRFMVLVGLGLYLPYVAIHTTIFERLIAMSRDRANVGYLMYLADSFGYLGYVVVMVARSASSPSQGSDFLSFFRIACLVASVIGLILGALGWAYFASRGSAASPLESGSRSVVHETQESLR